REQCPLERLLRLALLRAPREHLVDTHLLPELLEDVDAAVGPRVAHRHTILSIKLPRRWILADAQDARGQPPESLAIHIVRAPEVVHHLRHSAAARDVPSVLGELEVADDRAIRVPTLRLPQVHA